MNRASATLAIGATICALCTTAPTPVAHADPLDGPRAAVQKARAQSTCAPLNYNIELENAAQQFARNDKSVKNVKWPGYAGGDIQLLDGYGDPQSAAIDGLMSGAGGYVRDCRYKDYGVGFVRVGERDTVSLALGQGLPYLKFAMVVGSADVYKDPKDIIPDPANHVVWTIGTLKNGAQVTLDTPCKDGWCLVISKDIEAGRGYVQQAHLRFN